MNISTAFFITVMVIVVILSVVSGFVFGPLAAYLTAAGLLLIFCFTALVFQK